MLLLAKIAPDDSHHRRQHRLARRTYYNKVSICNNYKVLYIC